MTKSIYLDILIGMDAVSLFKSLADPTRLRLLHLCLQFELNVNEIVQALEMGQSRISRHLRILSDNGLLTHRKDGLWTFYTVNSDSETAAILPFLKKRAFNREVFEKDAARAREVVRQRSLMTTRFFNSIAGDWERLKRDIFKNFDLQTFVLSRLPEVDSIADLGCGTGDLLQPLLRQARIIIGIDKSERMLQRARDRFNHRSKAVDLRIGEMEHLPMRDGEVEAAIVNMSLHHLAVPEQALREIHRVIRPEGYLLLIDLDKHNHEEMRDIYGDQWLGFDAEDLLRQLRSSGFVPEKPEFFQLNKGLRGLFIRAKTQTTPPPPGSGPEAYKGENHG